MLCDRYCVFSADKIQRGCVVSRTSPGAGLGSLDAATSQGPRKSSRDAGNSRVGVYDRADASVRVDVCVWGHAAAATTGRDKLARLGKQQGRGARQLVAIVAIVSQSKAGARRKDADDVALVRRRRLGPRLGEEAGGT